MEKGLSRPDIVDLLDIHIVKFSSIVSLNLDLLGHFSVRVDLMTFESTEDSVEAALFYFVPAFRPFIISQ